MNIRASLSLIKNFINKYKFIFIGFVLISLYFWNRFFRLRSSKTLPLDLSIIKFFTLVYLCLIFFYIIISLIISKKTNTFVEKFLEWLFIPIIEFDNYLKNISFVKVYYEKALNYILKQLQNPSLNTYILFILLWLIPRMILVTVLFIDVFIFHHLHYKYYFIFIGLFLFLNRYFRFILKTTKTQLLTYYKLYISNIETDYYPGVHPAELQPDYDPNDPDNDEYCEFMYLPFEIFIEFQTKSIVYENITRNFNHINTTLKAFEELWEKHIGSKDPIQKLGQKVPENYTNIFGDKRPDNYYKAQSLVFEKNREYGKNAIKEVMKISLLLEYYNKTSNNDEKIKRLKILIYVNYLICWLYILIISLPSLDLQELVLTLIKTWLTLQDPFSDEFLYNILY